MRNLALAETSVRTFGDLNSGSITSTVLDTDNGTLWMTSERINGDADVVVDVWKIDAIGLDDQVRSFSTLDLRNTQIFSISSFYEYADLVSCDTCIVFDNSKESLRPGCYAAGGLNISTVG